MSWEKFDVALLGGGSAAAQLNHWVDQAIRDCLDPNKDREKVRKVDLRINIQAAADGESAMVSFTVVPKFPPDSAGQDMVQIQRQNGQAYLNTDRQPELPFDPETGEVTEIRGAK